MTTAKRRRKPRLLVPEVVQTSDMDCGPAALSSLLAGFGLSVSYERLREACQTDVDGTSIDTIEAIAVQLGLDAEQIITPLDHALLPEGMTLPGIFVVRRPGGVTHFVVAWRRHRGVVQVMDPSTGRRWPSCRRFFDELHEHTQTLPAEAWRVWAGTEEFLGALRRRWALLRLDAAETDQLLAAAVADPDWFPLATLDAATRMLTAIVEGGGLSRGRQATRGLTMFVARALADGPARTHVMPRAYWMVRPASPGLEEEPYLQVRGAVVVRVRGWQTAHAGDLEVGPNPSFDTSSDLPADLAAALHAPPSQPGRQLLRFLRADGFFTPMMLGISALGAAGSVMVEALLWRGLVDLSRDLGLVHQRLSALVAFLLFLSALVLGDLWQALGLARLGRGLETRLRIAFQTKIPRLGDRYLQSRPMSDMAERMHSVHRLRLLPGLGGRLLRVAAEILFTTAGLIWLDPAHALLAIFTTACILGLPLTTHALLTERELRSRTHGGALSRFSLDALLGLTAVRTHGAERAMHREFENRLTEWARAGLHLQRAVVGVGGVQGLLGFGLAAGLVAAYVSGGEVSGVLLLAYWALRLPVLGQELMQLAQQYPGHRNAALRLLEPLGAGEDLPAIKVDESQPVSLADTLSRQRCQGVSIALEHVSVRAAGHTILADLNLTLAPGSHVAIVGASGAGKSSLVGLFLGWHRPTTGRVLVDERPLDDTHLAWLRQVTAWVDPAVQLWNRSLLDNLNYGVGHHDTPPAVQVVEQAALRQVLDLLPDGLQTRLGEGGGLVSGGEGQRVRFGRALARSGARLVILDEPFRGLDGEQRRALLQQARQVWRFATLLCITHDVRVTQAFERVVVVDDGRIVEDGDPSCLAKHDETHYRSLLDAETAVHEGLWANGVWRRLQLVEGRLHEKGSVPPAPEDLGHVEGGL